MRSLEPIGAIFSHQTGLHYRRCLKLRIRLLAIVLWLINLAPEYLVLDGEVIANEDFVAIRSLAGRTNNLPCWPALQENAEDAAESIQKRGDMMRFILHENKPDFIDMQNKVEYLHNFIALQKLGTQSSPILFLKMTLGFKNVITKLPRCNNSVCWNLL